MKEFIEKSNVLLVGLKNTSKNSVRKYFTDSGLKSHNIEVKNTIEEASTLLQQKDYNVIFIDDETEDIKKIDQFVYIIKEKYPDKNNRLAGILNTTENKIIADGFLAVGGDLSIQKPYTMETFHKSLEQYFLNLGNEQKSKKQQELKNKEIKNKAKKVYSDFKMDFEFQKSDYDEKFQNACQEFLDSLEEEVNEKSLSNILNIGLEYKNYEALNLFVKAWIQIFPIQDEVVADVTRVLIYNKNFELMNNLSPTDKNAKLALGAGMIVAAIANQNRTPELYELIVSLIKKGLELANFKNVITYKAIEVLIHINAKDLAQEIFNSEIVQQNISTDPELLEKINTLLNN